MERGGGRGYNERTVDLSYYQLLLSPVIDVKYGCFTFFLAIIKRALFGLACVAC